MYLCVSFLPRAATNACHCVDILLQIASEALRRHLCAGAAHCVPAQAADTLSLTHDARARSAFLPVSFRHFLSRRGRAVVPPCDLSRAGPDGFWACMLSPTHNTQPGNQEHGSDCFVRGRRSVCTKMSAPLPFHINKWYFIINDTCRLKFFIALFIS